MQRRALAPVAAFAACLTGCFGAVGPVVNEQFDRSTGITVTTSDAPMVFARTESQYSRSARDYIYLGPVETNRQGTRDYYLWVGVATTLDRGYLAPEAERRSALYIDVQGEPMILDLKPWSERAPGLDAVNLYSTAVDVGDHLAARVSLHQLAVIASESLESVRVEDTAGALRRYRRWSDEQSWHGFFRETLASESVASDSSRTR